MFFFQIALLKRAVEKFKSQLAVDNGSMCSDPSPKNSLTYHRINPISPTSSSAYQQQPQAESHGKRVTTSAIVSHEMDGSKSSRLKSSRLAGGQYSAGSSSLASNDQVQRSEQRSSLKNSSSNVKWKDQDSLREVNASLTRLDSKIMHLETLLAKLTDRLGQQAEADQEDNEDNSKEAKESEDKSSAI